MGVFILAFAFTQGVFPKPPDFSKLHAFDLSFFASHPRFLLFVLTALAIAGLVGFALLSTKVKAFWARVRQGLTIIFDRKRYFREVWLVQFGGWCSASPPSGSCSTRSTSAARSRTCCLVLGVNAVAAVRAVHPRRRRRPAGVPGEGLRRTAAGATVAAYSVGQQIAIAAFSLAVGFFALVTVFKFRSFKEVIAAGREHREAERAARWAAGTLQ